MNNIAEQIYALVKSLPQEQAREVLSFAEFIRNKNLNDNQPIDTADSVSWAELVYSLAGTWKEDFLSLEDIRAEMGQDILRESL
ncbi:DUF2281 domain-containing protein [Nostoc sp. 'Lobaria pulmonaria (5183) cyanobiont']|uniref:DUF2281 domain-containing protein n=1 Tax=Nostoc sp. 'Lobaria pulmonaria (5183) cyanobiont' TaxID=1618022 RepID=UPI000CF30A09|nr:DUF2281 domain-containing protein [Nostoc sp. 'Lobaria pulmonaria (5183) cyanobiont']AVH73527.1 protein of unknown function DUF2281 [Nostoc sp. 'Lobaria pulmonaria (5183) cyanobiont']